uniref:Uncharacterized protein n=1 Tax=Chenopodium quinoa TaxID=63459 RepID=A0A803ND54_CHEQI
MLPKIFPSEYLQELDAAEYEEVIGAPWMPVNSGERLNVFIKDCLAEYQEIICSPETDMPTVEPELSVIDEEDERSMYDGEVFDALTTHRGELKRTSMSHR